MKIEHTKNTNLMGARLAVLFANEREVLLAFFGSRTLLWMVGWFGFFWLKHGEHQIFPGTQLWNLLFHWDALWYARIVAHGYDYAPGTQSSVAFFPLLPMAIYALRALTGSGTAFAGFLITNTCLFVSAVLLRRIAQLDFFPPSRVPERSLWFLLLCPMTFFHSAVYTESLFLMFSLGAILFARKRQWLGAGICGAMLTATRTNALLILVPLLWEAFAPSAKSENREANDRGISASRWWLLLVPSGLVAYSVYLFTRFGDPLAFLRVQAAFHREGASLLTAFNTATRYPVPYGAFFIASAVTAIAVCGFGFVQRVRLSYQLYALAMLALCLSTSIWESLPRYLSVVFPFYITLGSVRSESLRTLLLSTSAAIMVLCSLLFVCGYFMT
jgi:Mannosyltransferase (PIG-V)